MTDFVERDVTHLGVDRVATSPTAFALYENLFAFAQKAVGAPVLANDYIVAAMIAAGQITLAKMAAASVGTSQLVDGNVTQAKVASGAVGQAQLKTATGNVSSSGIGSVNLTLPGGSYGFYPTVTVTGGANPNTVDDIRIWGPTVGQPAGAAYISLGASGNADMVATQRYIQASPPYNLGNGDIALFVFALLERSGKVRATYVAPEPPWAYNGPTDIRADYYKKGRGKAQLKGFQRPRLTAKQRRDLRRASKREPLLASLASAKDVEVTHAIKNADMPLVPHPFLGNDLSGCSVVLLDPVGAICEKLAQLHSAGACLSELLHAGDLRIDNEPLDAKAPPGVHACRVAWRR